MRQLVRGNCAECGKAIRRANQYHAKAGAPIYCRGQCSAKQARNKLMHYPKKDAPSVTPLCIGGQGHRFLVEANVPGDEAAPDTVGRTCQRCDYADRVPRYLPWAGYEKYTLAASKLLEFAQGPPGMFLDSVRPGTG